MFFNSHQNDFLTQFNSISNQYEIISLINYSSNTIVVKALHRFSKKIVAIKKYNNVFNTNYNAKKILREINILRQFSEIPHKNIIQLYDIYIPNEKDINEIYLIMEFCESNLKNNLKFLDNQDYIIKILKDVLNGLYYCFKRGVIHRDIKPENILINFSNGNFTAKICDFNLARDLTLTYKTYQLIQYFIDSYKDNKFTEEGVNIELIIDKLNNHKLDENLKIYLQKKLNSFEKNLYKNNKNPLNYKNFVIESLKIENKYKDYYKLYKLLSKDDQNFRSELSPNIVSRWYRPPEILLLENIYTYSVDIWSLGCVLGEMLLNYLKIENNSFLPGNSSYFNSPQKNEENGISLIDDYDQINLIINLCKNLNESDVNFISKDYQKKFFLARYQYFYTYEQNKNVDIFKYFEKCDDKLVYLLKEMLQFNPMKRIHPKKALELLEIEIKDEENYKQIDNFWDFKDLNENDLKEAFLKEKKIFEEKDYFKIKNIKNNLLSFNNCFTSRNNINNYNTMFDNNYLTFNNDYFDNNKNDKKKEKNKNLINIFNNNDNKENINDNYLKTEIDSENENKNYPLTNRSKNSDIKNLEKYMKLLKLNY